MVYLDSTKKTVKHLCSKASKKPVEGFASFLRVYDADTDEIVSIWLRTPSTLNCPMLQCCQDCGRCLRK